MRSIRTFLVCIAQKHTKIPESFATITFGEGVNISLGAIVRKTEEATGNKVDGQTNYIEWIEV